MSHPLSETAHLLLLERNKGAHGEPCVYIHKPAFDLSVGPYISSRRRKHSDEFLIFLKVLLISAFVCFGCGIASDVNATHRKLSGQ